MKKKLYVAIRYIFNQYGKDVVKDIRLVNILDDTFTFQSLPAAKPLLKDILKSGYGDKLYELGNGDGWKLKSQFFTTELVNVHGYRRDIVKYIFECLAYGLSWTDSVKDYSFQETSHDNTVKSKIVESKTISSDFNYELTRAKKEYVKVLEEGIIIHEEDSDYYPAMVNNQLDFLMEKINMLSETLNVDNAQWCLEKNQEVFARYSKDVYGLKKKALAKTALPTITILLGGGCDEKKFEEDSNSNVLFVTTRCNNKCVMYCQPPHGGDEIDWYFEQNKRLVLTAPKGTKEVCITGGEPTKIGEKLIDMVKLVRDYLPNTSIYILSNGRNFQNNDYTHRLADIDSDKLIFWHSASLRLCCRS